MKKIKSLAVIILLFLIALNTLATGNYKAFNTSSSHSCNFFHTSLLQPGFMDLDTRKILDDINPQIKHQKRPVFLSIQPGYTVEPFYEKGAFDLNIFPLNVQFPLNRVTDLRVTSLVNYHLAGEQKGFADLGLHLVLPIHFKKKESISELSKGIYVGPMFGFSRNPLNEHYTTNLAIEAGYQFPSTKSFSISMGLQLGGTHFTYDHLPNKWGNHFGFKFNIGFWVNKEKN